MININKNEFLTNFGKFGRCETGNYRPHWARWKNNFTMLLKIMLNFRWKILNIVLGSCRPKNRLKNSIRNFRLASSCEFLILRNFGYRVSRFWKIKSGNFYRFRQGRWKKVKNTFTILKKFNKIGDKILPTLPDRLRNKKISKILNYKNIDV